jgi:DNA polymerase-3 subunit delta'
MRELCGSFALKSARGRGKVAVLDDADDLNDEAANCFLKTLEEPPDDSLIILISSNPDRLPDTIRSRCSRINFTPLSLEACKQVIEKVISQQEAAVGQKGRKPKGKQANKQKPAADSEQFSTLMRLSMGRPGNVISGDLIEEREWFIKLLKGMLGTEKDGWTSRDEMEKWFDLMLTLLRDMAVLKMNRDAYLINIDMKEYINKLSSSVDIKVIIENYQRLSTLKRYFIFNLNKSLTWNYTGSMLRKIMGDIYA